MFGFGLLNELMRSDTSQANQPIELKQSPDETQNELDRLNLTLGRFGKNNIDWLVAPLTASLKSKFSRSYSYERSNYTRNYFFYSPFSKTSRWLIDNHRSIVLGIQQPKLNEVFNIGESHNAYYDDTDTIVRAPFYLVLLVNKDTNQDNQLGNKDQKTLVMAKLDGQDLKVILSDISEIKFAELKTNSDNYQLYLLYLHEQQLKSAKFDISHNLQISSPIIRPVSLNLPSNTRGQGQP